MAAFDVVDGVCSRRRALAHAGHQRGESRAARGQLPRAIPLSDASGCPKRRKCAGKIHADAHRRLYAARSEMSGSKNFAVPNALLEPSMASSPPVPSGVHIEVK